MSPTGVHRQHRRTMSATSQRRLSWPHPPKWRHRPTTAPSSSRWSPTCARSKVRSRISAMRWRRWFHRPAERRVRQLRPPPGHRGSEPVLSLRELGDRGYPRDPHAHAASGRFRRQAWWSARPQPDRGTRAADRL